MTKFKDGKQLSLAVAVCIGSAFAISCSPTKRSENACKVDDRPALVESFAVAKSICSEVNTNTDVLSTMSLDDLSVLREKAVTCQESWAKILEDNPEQFNCGTMTSGEKSDDGTPLTTEQIKNVELKKAKEDLAAVDKEIKLAEEKKALEETEAMQCSEEAPKAAQELDEQCLGLELLSKKEKEDLAKLKSLGVPELDKTIDDIIECSNLWNGFKAKYSELTCALNPEEDLSEENMVNYQVVADEKVKNLEESLIVVLKEKLSKEQAIK